jgi:hypothetical protein
VSGPIDIPPIVWTEGVVGIPDGEGGVRRRVGRPRHAEQAADARPPRAIAVGIATPALFFVGAGTAQAEDVCTAPYNQGYDEGVFGGAGRCFADPTKQSQYDSGCSDGAAGRPSNPPLPFPVFSPPTSEKSHKPRWATAMDAKAVVRSSPQSFRNTTIRRSRTSRPINRGSRCSLRWSTDHLSSTAASDPSPSTPVNVSTDPRLPGHHTGLCI